MHFKRLLTKTHSCVVPDPAYHASPHQKIWNKHVVPKNPLLSIRDHILGIAMMKYTLYIIRLFVTNRHASEAVGVGVAYLRW